MAVPTPLLARSLTLSPSHRLRLFQREGHHAIPHAERPRGGVDEVLTEEDAALRTPEGGEGPQGLLAHLPSRLIDRGDRATRAGFRRVEDDLADPQAADVILAEGRAPGDDDVRAEAVYRQRLGQADI